ncbi:MAG: FimB/Mfa2 family fimbrial subunit [Prevotella sp.]|nr:FimB/Mfa2 family fimbrial subunit [Prevotella sp.]
MVTDEESVEDRDMSTVTLRASLYNIVAFGTRAVQDIKEYCSHITFAVYDADGKVVKTVEQSQGDSGYGEVTLTLAPATYKLLVLAHSSYGGTPSVTTPANIAFTNSIGYSDTFYYYNDLEVTGKNQALTLELQRAVTMLRFTINDELPSDLTKIRCQWSGASGTLNATTGWGGNATDQVAIYAVDGLTAPLTLRLYTFMRQETGTLNLTVNAYDSSNNVIAERTFTDVPVKNHMVTDFSGNFFSKGESDYSISLKAETEWGVYQDLTF